MTLAMRIAAQSVLRNWRHSIATLFSIALGVVAVASIHGYNVDVEDQFGDFYIRRGMTGHVLVEAEENNEDNAAIDGQTSAKILAAAKQFPGKFVSMVRFLAIEGIIAGPNSTFNFHGLAYDVMPGEVSRGERWAWNALYGKPLSNTAENQIIVGKGLAELLGCKIQDLVPKQAKDGRYEPYDGQVACMGPPFQMTAITDKNRMNAWDAPIVGIVDAGLREMEDSWLMMPLDQAQKFVNTDKITTIGFTLEDPGQARDLVSFIEAKFPQKSTKIVVKQWTDHKVSEVFRSMMGSMNIFQQFILLVVASVSILSMINSIIRNIDERQREIGMLRAVGYKSKFVSQIFAWEGFFLGLFGSIFGTALIILLLSGLNSANVLYYPALISQKVPLRIAFVPFSYLFLSLFLAGGSAMTAMIVARLRISKNIADILR